MSNAEYRAFALLKAKPGEAQALLEFTLEVLPEIRKVDGLQRMEVNRDIADPSHLVLLYWWQSPAHSQRYVAGPVYAAIAPRLKSLVAEHALYMTENIA
jgi:quinol monooxygenase YgiN